TESSLDYFGSRYYASVQGRFTSADEFWKDSNVGDPQSWNKYAYVRNDPLLYVDPTGNKADVTIQTDEANHTGTITVHATIALWSDDPSVSQEDLQAASASYKKQIESAWTGTFTKDGITYTVTTTVDVQVYDNKKDAINSGAQNVVDAVRGASADRTRAFWVSAGLGYQGADSGVWNFNTRNAGHEFGHLLGVDEHNSPSHNVLNSSSNIMDQYNSKLPQKATTYDLDLAFGSAATDHRETSRPTSRSLDLGPGYGVGLHSSSGDRRNYTSRTTLRAGPWWR
ncbi:MAG: RHS repeat-associated core domain-containing protein, partial [Blastocatellia bacterium]